MLTPALVFPRGPAEDRLPGNAHRGNLYCTRRKQGTHRHAHTHTHGFKRTMELLARPRATTRGSTLCEDPAKRARHSELSRPGPSASLVGFDCRGPQHAHERNHIEKAGHTQTRTHTHGFKRTHEQTHTHIAETQAGTPHTHAHTQTHARTSAPAALTHTHANHDIDCWAVRLVAQSPPHTHTPHTDTHRHKTARIKADTNTHTLQEHWRAHATHTRTLTRTRIRTHARPHRQLTRTHTHMRTMMSIAGRFAFVPKFTHADLSNRFPKFPPPCPVAGLMSTRFG
jgi:hypothetical protein